MVAQLERDQLTSFAIPANLDRLLLINDLINNVIKRYDAFKAGDRSATAEIDPACVPRSEGISSALPPISSH